ncbi:MAG: helix-turn-helix domain-containing protein [Planctomycetota bacterium]|nr:helix-turn-helix domain-containing protein [Planctomycetota bacterium]
MKRTSIVLSVSQRHRLIREAARTKDAALRTRYMIVRHTAEGKSQREIARMLGCSVSTVKRTRTRWRESGEAGLMDRREDNTPAKADELYAADLLAVLQDTPRDHGHRRPTWTQELMIRVMNQRGHEAHDIASPIEERNVGPGAAGVGVIGNGQQPANATGALIRPGNVQSPGIALKQIVIPIQLSDSTAASLVKRSSAIGA